MSLLATPPLILVVDVLRLLMTLSWGEVFVRLFPAFIRTLKKSPEPNDIFRLLFWCVAFLNLLFSVRWLIFPQAVKAMVTPELAMWSITYAFSALLGRAVRRAVRPHGC